MAHPDRIGPFVNLTPLGRGGMGVVYRAEHATDGRIVALKTVAGIDADLIERVRREIRVLARLGHPGIVRIVAEGELDGVPWFAMELLEGETLAQRIGTASPAVDRGAVAPTVRFHDDRNGPAGAAPAPHRGPIADGLAIVHHLCAPLAYLHGEGVVHRDVKPDNVLVRPDGAPVLLDFGLVSHLASSSSRESLQIDSQSVGTIAYMAPEQGMGQEVDARADLYSLGCILYEVITGAPPFASATPAETLRRRYVEDPDAPSRRAPGTPEALDRLVLKLLARDPRERIGYAADVARALERIGVPSRDDVRAPAARPYVYRPGFVGRDRVMGGLVPHLEALADGRGGLLLVSGESGVGKTRVAAAFGAKALDMSLRVLAGDCPPATASLAGPARVPLRALRGPLRAIADRCLEGGPEVSEAILGNRAARLAPYEPVLEVFVTGRHPGSADLAGEAARLRLFRDLAATLEAMAEERPLVVVLDDLQWADEVTLGFLRFLARSRRFDDKPVLLLGTYRSEESGTALPALAAMKGVSETALERLPADAVGSMVTEMLALPSPPDALAAFLARHSEGNPFFVAEYLQTAVTEGLLSRDDEGRWRVDDTSTGLERPYDRLPLPASIRDVARQRLSGLDPESRRALDACAVLGRDFALRFLRDVAGLGREAAMDAAASLLHRRILEDLPGGALGFTHDKLREVAYDDIAPEARARLHGRAAAALDDALPADRPDRDALLAHHWHQAGDLPRARRHYLPAARRALAQHALEEAERHFHAHLSLLDGPPSEAIDVRLELVDTVLLAAGRIRAGLEETDRALDAARALGARSREARSLLVRGRCLRRLGNSEEAGTSVRAAQAIYAEIGDELEAVRVRQDVGAVMWEKGDARGAGDVFRDLIAFHRARGADGTSDLALAVGAMGSVRVTMGAMAEARTYFEEAIRLWRSLGSAREADILTNLANVLRELGGVDEATLALERALAIVRRIGDRRQEGLALTTLGAIHGDAGHMAEARETFDAAIRIHREVGNRRAEGIDVANLGMLHREEGDLQRAVELLREAIAIHKEVGDRRSEGYGAGHLAAALAALGDDDGARRTFAAANALLDETHAETMKAAVLVLRAASERRSGDLAAAGRSLGEAEAIDARLPSSQLHLPLLCERGHLALARGEDASAFVLDATRAVPPGMGPESLAARRVATLSRAIEAASRGDALAFGEPGAP
ncbi:MAG: protein kinase [Acidobacteriota bacterium]